MPVQCILKKKIIIKYPFRNKILILFADITSLHLWKNSSILINYYIPIYSYLYNLLNINHGMYIIYVPCVSILKYHIGTY